MLIEFRKKNFETEMYERFDPQKIIEFSEDQIEKFNFQTGENIDDDGDTVYCESVDERRHSIVVTLENEVEIEIFDNGSVLVEKSITDVLNKKCSTEIIWDSRSDTSGWYVRYLKNDYDNRLEESETLDYDEDEDEANLMDAAVGSAPQWMTDEKGGLYGTIKITFD